MALFDAIRISELPPSELIFKDDLMVVDRFQADRSYVTNAVRIGKLVDYITTLDLNFTGNVTFNNTIQPLPGNSLDAIFNNVTIKESITLEEGVEVNGLYLDDLEDVTVENPAVGDIIMYVNDPVTRDSQFKNVPGVTEAPMDGRIYGRSNGQWVDITDCLRCPTGEIGQVVIIKTDSTPAGVDIVHSYRATTPTADPALVDLTYVWTANSDQVVFANPTRKSTNITFISTGIYILTCQVSSETATDSPQIGKLTVNVGVGETCRITTDPDGEYVITENGDHLQFEPNDCPTSTETNRITNEVLEPLMTEDDEYIAHE